MHDAIKNFKFPVLWPNFTHHVGLIYQAIFEQLSLSKLADTREKISSVPGPLSQFASFKRSRASVDQAGLTAIFFGYLQKN
jgi:hypothetical protein